MLRKHISASTHVRGPETDGGPSTQLDAQYGVAAPRTKTTSVQNVGRARRHNHTTIQRLVTVRLLSPFPVPNVDDAHEASARQQRHNQHRPAGRGDEGTYPASGAKCLLASNCARTLLASSFHRSRSMTHESSRRSAVRYSRVTFCVCVSTCVCFMAATTVRKPLLRFMTVRPVRRATTTLLPSAWF
jgi:hypothetical protein